MDSCKKEEEKEIWRTSEKEPQNYNNRIYVKVGNLNIPHGRDWPPRSSIAGCAYIFASSHCRNCCTSMDRQIRKVTTEPKRSQPQAMVIGRRGRKVD
ncbi:hypothetical protein CEXT_50761 [Caerostris extrusa]|uniref:Uncharacterized protein n=1 Tax=Caerostris extrusa TaxID=172846 RepID=A0AAV4W807_CAEEX|nr:hypothetical protein CEXT_50761 [Caerostris extrusa]